MDKRRLTTIIVAIVAALIIIPTCVVQCTVVDNAEVGIKFKKFSLTEQGTLKTTPVTGFVFYNPITTSVFTYPVYIQRVDYEKPLQGILEGLF